MNVLSHGFGGGLVQRRGGLLPGTAAQTRCDVCAAPLNPTESTEVTISTPASSTRLAAHGRCSEGLAELARALVANKAGKAVPR